MGSNYRSVLLGAIVPPVPQSPGNFSSVNPAAGELDGSGNYFFTAGTGTMNANGTYNPMDFYIGKIANTQTLPPGAGNIVPTYALVNFTNLACFEFFSTLQAPVSLSSPGNTGIRDLVFNPRDGQLYTYVSFEYPAGSGTFKGQLLRLNSTTGDIFCYPSAVLPFANTSNEVAGTAINPAGEILILFTGGDIYKTVLSGPAFTGAITYLGPSGIVGGLRGDLAACVTSSGVVPVRFTNVSAVENNCKVDVKWTVSGEQQVSRYNVELADRNRFVSLSEVAATNQLTDHSYNITVPVTSKSMRLRIKQTDLDGSVTYAEIVSLNTTCAKTKNMAVLNSAAVANTLQVRFNNFQNAESVFVSIFNSTGAQLTQRSLTVNGLSGLTGLDVSKLPAGAYLIKAQTTGGENFTERFIKN
ncbi:MAG: T9SS type A sorting domain-containing protein [Ferruginibacter sp.]